MKRLQLIAMTLLLWALRPLLCAAEQQRLALLIGISKYKQDGPTPWPELHTEEDISQFKEVLQQHYGFKKADFRILQNEQATGAGIRQSFRQHLIDQASPGAVVVLYFSGHGQQILDDNGDELDGLDESLVPYDTASQQATLAQRTNLRDDEIGRWLSALRLKMTEGGKLRGSINVFLDSCHSGTATRGMLVERGRGWDPSFDGPLPVSQRAGQSKGGVGLFHKDEVEAGGYVLLSAARSYQTAKEVAGMGVFTRALVHALAQAGPDSSMRAVYDRLSDEVAGQAFNQDPVAEGDIDSVLFSGVAIPPQPYLKVAVDPMRPTQIRLPAGEVHGVTIGSKWAVHRAGSGPLISSNLLGGTIIESVAAFESWARLPKTTTTAQLVAARAVELEHVYAGRQLRVHFLGLEALPSLRKKLATLPQVESATATDYQIQVTLDLTKKRILIRRPSAAQPIADLPADDQGVKEVIHHLLGEWRWQRLSALTSSNDTLKVGLRLVPVVAQLNQQGVVDTKPQDRNDVPSGRTACLHGGEFFQVEVDNLSTEPQFISIIELSSSGDIEVVFPHEQRPDDSRIASGHHRLPYQPYTFQVTNPPGKTRYKAIMTRQAVDFRSLMHRTSSQRRQVQATMAQAQTLGRLAPLAELLMEVAVANSSTRAGTGGVPPDAWGTADAWLDVPIIGQTCPSNK